MRWLTTVRVACTTDRNADLVPRQVQALTDERLSAVERGGCHSDTLSWYSNRLHTGDDEKKGLDDERRQKKSSFASRTLSMVQRVTWIDSDAQK